MLFLTSLFSQVHVCMTVNAITADAFFPTRDQTAHAPMYNSAFSNSIHSSSTSSLLLHPVDSPENESVYIIQNRLTPFEGKIIRHILIESLDPFGYIIADTGIANSNLLTRAGNRLHSRSKELTIQHLLLIRPNDVFDSLLVKESERLVRRNGYVIDVRFYTSFTSANSDSVDIIVRLIDKWTIIPKLAFTDNYSNYRLTETNLFGLGQEIQGSYSISKINSHHYFYAKYHNPNIYNTYIRTTLQYGSDEFQNFIKSISVDRTFYSSFTRWAGGITFSQQLRKDTFQTIDSLIISRQYKFTTQDYWIGKGTPILRGRSQNARSTLLITSLRYLNINYTSPPPEAEDSLFQFTDSHFYMGSIGITTRKYIQDKYIFNYGLREDVPVGRAINLTAGYLEKNKTGNVYIGSSISHGNYYKWGYLSSGIAFGTFLQRSKVSQGLVAAGITYFTPLLEIRKWRFRQFVKPTITIGIKRNPGEALSINDGFGLDGFTNSELTGESRILLKLQSQSYAPWNVLGFRFGPYLIGSLGMLSNAHTDFARSKVYSQLGVGMLIKNENLVLNTFQLSISFYTFINNNEQNSIQFNSLKTTDFDFRVFELGKPEALEYR